MSGLRVLARAGLCSLILAAQGCALSEEETPREASTSSQALRVSDCLPGATGPGVYDGDIYVTAAGSSASLEDFGGVTCVTGDVLLDYSGLTDLSALSKLQVVGGRVIIGHNDLLTDLTGLENLRSVGGPLEISGNDALTSLASLAALSHVGGNPDYPLESGLLRVANNGRLPACWAWALEKQTVGCGQPDWQGGWLECVDNLGQGSCGSLPPDFECVPGAKGPGVFDGSVWITPWHDNSPELDELGGLTCVTGVLAIYGTAGENLQQLAGLRMIGGALMISDNPQLSTLSGLENLEFVGEQLSIASNPLLSSLAPLSKLTRLGDLFEPGVLGNALWVASNASLPEYWVDALERQTDTVCGQHDGLGGTIGCAGN